MKLANASKTLAFGKISL